MVVARAWWWWCGWDSSADLFPIHVYICVCVCLYKISPWWRRRLRWWWCFCWFSRLPVCAHLRNRIVWIAEYVCNDSTMWGEGARVMRSSYLMIALKAILKGFYFPATHFPNSVATCSILAIYGIRALFVSCEKTQSPSLESSLPYFPSHTNTRAQLQGGIATTVWMPTFEVYKAQDCHEISKQWWWW